MVKETDNKEQKVSPISKRTRQQIKARIEECNQDLKRLWSDTGVKDERGFIEDYDFKKHRHIEDYRSDLYWELEQMDKEKV